ncbi:hypothetical protein PGT21_026205 [Puccinia graminis f. sp. tritici]|uniref:Mediator of RNA polymerase II transcription subunit 7 n=1 Tax=Puccinia graminis f. sp. tritici TaxID=56615 RepID=A0A5B0QYF9_PUCGR|nr:hypothetical protein PGT21_026205 [Puccinia graminis f. sp. tritici]
MESNEVNSSFFPPPPPRHKLFTNKNLSLAKRLRAEADDYQEISDEHPFDRSKQQEIVGEELNEVDLRTLIQPPLLDWIRQNNGWNAFGDHEPWPDCSSGRASLEGMPKLYDPKMERKDALQALLNTLIHGYLELLQVLTNEGPTSLSTSTTATNTTTGGTAGTAPTSSKTDQIVSHIELTAFNIHGLCNELRPRQARETLKLMVAQQASEKRQKAVLVSQKNATTDNVLPLTDPEAILKTANAEKRRIKQNSTRSIAPLPATSNTISNIMSDAVPPPGGQEPPAADSTRDSTRTADGSDMSTAKEWFKAVLKIQHSAITQAQEDRRQALEDRRADRQLFLAVHQASADRIGRLEDLLLAMNIKNEVNARTEQPAPGRIDLQKFRTSDGPTYRGPFQETEPFLRWIHGVQIFFETKSVSNAADKIKILGNLVEETNLQAFYANEASSFLNKSWEEFKIRMFDFALPNNWRSGLQRQIRKLDMLPTETFLDYSTRARTLQSLFNFDAEKFSKLGDLQLAQFLVYGLPDSLQDRIYERQLLEASPFAYGQFEKQANASFLALQRPTELPSLAKSTSNAPPTLGRDEFIWRVHAYLDSQGLCHFCKKHCGNAAGACPGPIDRSHINIPNNFQTPTKPLDYVAPRAWSRPTAGPGRTSQPPAGRPSARAASVAGIAEVSPLEAQVAGLTVDAAIREDARLDHEFDDEGCFPALGTAAVAALEDLDAQLLQNEIDRATQISSGWTGNLADDIAGC